MKRNPYEVSFELFPPKTKSEIKAMLDDYLALGVNHLIVLRGDLPAGQTSFEGDFRNFANGYYAKARQDCIFTR